MNIDSCRRRWLRAIGLSPRDPAGVPQSHAGRPGGRPKGAGRWIRPLVLLAVLVAGVAVALTIRIPANEEIQAWTTRAGWAAPVLYAVIYASLTLTPAPKTIASITAGVLFGLPLGAVVVMAGAVAGSAVGFALGRFLGRGAVVGVDNPYVRRLDARLRRRGLIAVIGIRLVPMLPFAAVNCACGLSAVRTRDYLLGTGLGLLPGTIAYVTIGAFGGTPGSAPFVLAIAGLAVLAVVGVVALRRHRDVEPG